MVMNDPAIRIIFFIVRIRIVGEGQEDITHQIVFFERSGKNFASCDESHLVNSPEACFDSNKTEFVIHARTKFYSR